MGGLIIIKILDSKMDLFISHEAMFFGLLAFTLVLNTMFCFRKKRTSKYPREFILSFFFIGAGQFAAKKYVRGLLFFGALIAGLGFAYILEDKEMSKWLIVLAVVGSPAESFI